MATNAALRPSHEQLVHDFFASCDEVSLAIVEARYPVLDRRDWEDIERNERNSESFDNLTPAERPNAVPVRAQQPHHRRRTPIITSLDQCQVCGSHDARCECCG